MPKRTQEEYENEISKEYVQESETKRIKKEEVIRFKSNSLEEFSKKIESIVNYMKQKSGEKVLTEITYDGEYIVRASSY
jgi:hypothetical protein